MAGALDEPRCMAARTYDFDALVSLAKHKSTRGSIAVNGGAFWPGRCH